MYIRSMQVLSDIADKVNDMQIRLDEIRNLMPDDLSFKTLRQLAKEIIAIGKEMKSL
jgi:hypothetical protein